MIIDEIKEFGNENLFKGEYDKAIGTFIQAYACLKWLFFKDGSESEEEPKTNKTVGNNGPDCGRRDLIQVTPMTIR